MANRLADRIRLAREELEGQTTDSTNNVDGTIDVVEAIQQENDAVEITELQNEVESDSAAMEELEEVQGELEEQAQEDEEIINGVEDGVVDESEVKPENVQASQEALRIALKRMGESTSQYNLVSHEDIVDNPYRALKLSHEGIKEWIQKIIDGIKSLFKKIVSFVKKIWTKIKAFFGNLDAKLENLESILKAKEAKGYDRVTGLDGDKKKAIVDAFGPVFCASIGSDISKIPGNVLVDIVTAAGIVTDRIKENNKLMIQGAKSFDELITLDGKAVGAGVTINKKNGSQVYQATITAWATEFKAFFTGCSKSFAPFRTILSKTGASIPGSNDLMLTGSKNTISVLRLPDLDVAGVKTAFNSDESVIEAVKDRVRDVAKEIKLEKIPLTVLPATEPFEKVTLGNLEKAVKHLRTVVKAQGKLDELTKALDSSESNLSQIKTKVPENASFGTKIGIELFKMRSKVNKDMTLFLNAVVSDTFNNVRGAIAGVAKLVSYVGPEKDDE